MKTTPRIGEQSIGTLLQVQTMYHEEQRKHVKKRVKPEFARFKMKIYWRTLQYQDLSKNGQPMYSYDYFYRHIESEKFKIEDEREGLVELINEAKKQRELDTFISVVIWCCMTSEKQTKNSQYNCEVVKLVRHKPGIWFNPTLEFVNGRLNLEKIQFKDNYYFFK